MTFWLLWGLLWQAQPAFTVSGAVVHALSRRPVEKVRMYLAPALQRENARTVITGPDGSFRFEGVPPGKYSLQAERLGFALQAYKQRALAAGYSSAVVVGEGEPTTDLVFEMIPGAAIYGSVTDPDGQPVPRSAVGAFRVAGVGAHRRVASPVYAYADDRGRFRVHSLSAGSYVLACSGEPWPGATYGPPEVAYPVTFYPGATSAEGAGLVRLKPGQEVRADLVLNPVPSARVSGTLQVTGVSTGSRLVLSVPVSLTGGVMLGAEMQIRDEGRTSGKGFFINGVPPGRYLLTVGGSLGEVVARRLVDVVAPETVLQLGELGAAQVNAKVRVLGPPVDKADQVLLALRQVEGLGSLGRAVDSKGQASFPSISAGRYEIAAGSKNQFAVRSVKASGATASGSFVDIPDSGLVELEVEVDASVTDIKGRVFRGDAAQAAALVLLVPRSALENLSDYRADQSDSDGSFTWLGVGRGEYLMFAFDEGEAADYFDAQTIRALLSQGQPLTVTGEPAQSVKLALPPR